MIAIEIFAGFAAFYALMYYLNSKAEIPEGAKVKLEGCHGCNITSCELHSSN